MRTPIVSSMAVLTLGSLAALAGDPSRPDPEAKPAGKTAAPNSNSPRGARPDQSQSMAEREAAALAFVREHHPELASLLEQLKAMKPDQYERAIAELAQVGRTLANYKKNDERRYRLALEAWKAKSRAELLAAQLVTTPDAELEGQLRAAVENQLAVEIRQQRLEREIVEARLRKLDETIGRLESRRDALVESRYQALLKKGQRTRRLEAGRAAPNRPARVKGED